MPEPEGPRPDAPEPESTEPQNTEPQSTEFESTEFESSDPSGSPAPRPEPGVDEGPQTSRDHGMAAPTGRARLRQTFRTPGRGQIVVAVLLAVVGFAAVTEVRANQFDTTYAGRREEDLIDIFDGLSGSAERARREIRRLEQTKFELESDTTARRAALEAADERLRTLQVLAGRTPVQGRGIRVQITETTRPISITTLLDTLQELRTAGAEAIEFNNEIRVVAQTWFASTDEGVTVDGVLLTSPITLEAIGEPHTLEGAMDFYQGPQDQLRDNDLAEVRITQVEKLEIRSVRPPVVPRYATQD